MASVKLLMYISGIVGKSMQQPATVKFNAGQASPSMQHLCIGKGSVSQAEPTTTNIALIEALDACNLVNQKIIKR